MTEQVLAAVRRIKPKRRASVGSTAAIYARISQDKSGDGLGVERQLQACRELCERNGWEVLGEYVDNDISATKGRRRPQFEQLLLDRPERVVVWDMDRFLRLSKDLQRVIDLDMAVHAVTQGTNSLDLSTVNGRMMATVVVAFAQGEGEHKAERIELQQEQRASRGEPKWSRRPFGYEKDHTIREDEAQHVRDAYELVIRGNTLRGIARDWNARGILTTSGNPWRVTELGSFLRNARNAGILVFRGEEVGPGTWEGIVSEATFRAAARILNDPARRTNSSNGRRRYLMTGLATCAACGGSVTGSRIKSGKYAGEPAYRCAGRECFRVPVDYIDGRAFLTLLQILRDPTCRAKWGHIVTIDSDAASELAVERQRLADARNAFALDYADGLIDRAAMLAGSERIRGRLEEVERQLEEIGTGEVMGGWWHDTEYVAQELSRLSNDELRELLRAVTTSVRIHGRGRGRSKLHQGLLSVVDIADNTYPRT